MAGAAEHPIDDNLAVCLDEIVDAERRGQRAGCDDGIAKPEQGERCELRIQVATEFARRDSLDE